MKNIVVKTSETVDVLDKLRSSKAQDVIEALEELGVEWNANHNLHSGLRNNREFALKVVAINGDIFHELDEALRFDPTITTIAVGVNGLNLRYTSETLRDNKELVLIAFNGSGKHNGYALDAVSDRLKDDKDVVMAAISRNNTGTALQHASERLKNDYEVVLTAVKNSIMPIGSSLKRDTLSFASDSLKDNEVICEEALVANPECFKFVSERLKSDKEFAKRLLSKNNSTFAYSAFWSDSELHLIYIAASNFGGWLGLPEILSNDKEWMMKAVTISPEVILGMHLDFGRQPDMKHEDVYETIKTALDAGKKFAESDPNHMKKGGQIGHFLPHLKNKSYIKEHSDLVELLNRY